MKKEELLSKIRKNINKTYDMPSFDNMKGVVYDDKLKQFAEMSKTRRIPQQNPGEDGQRKEKTCGNEQKLKVSAINP